MAAAAAEEVVICDFIELTGVRCMKKCNKFRDIRRCSQHPPSRVQRPECKSRGCIQRARASHGFCKDHSYNNPLNRPSLPSRPCRFPEAIVRGYADDEMKLQNLKLVEPVLGAEMEDYVMAMRIRDYARSPKFLEYIEPFLPKELRRDIAEKPEEDADGNDGPPGPGRNPFE